MPENVHGLGTFFANGADHLEMCRMSQATHRTGACSLTGVDLLVPRHVEGVQIIRGLDDCDCLFAVLIAREIHIARFGLSHCAFDSKTYKTSLFIFRLELRIIRRAVFFANNMDQT